MKIILTQDIDNLGSLGDEVAVKPGYARNYLLPQGKALQITPSTKKLLEHQKALLSKKRKLAVDEAKSIATKIQEAKLVFTMKAGDHGKLFGSVTNKQIFDALEVQGVKLPKKTIGSSLHLKTVGTHIVPVKLHSEVVINMEVRVNLDQDSVKAQKAKDEAEEATMAEMAESAKEAAKEAEKEETENYED